jgi:hypothetical protein
MYPGTRGTNRFHTTISVSTLSPTAVVGIGGAGDVFGQHAHPLEEVSRHWRGEFDAEHIAQLRAGDDERDAIGETDDDRTRNKADGRAAAREPHDHQHDSRHHRAHEEAVEPVLGDDS